MANVYSIQFDVMPKNAERASVVFDALHKMRLLIGLSGTISGDGKPTARFQLTATYEELRQSRGTGFIGYLDPRSQNYTRLPSPIEEGEKIPQEKVNGINIDPQDRVWFENRADRALGLYDPKTQEFSMWPFPKPPQDTNPMNMVRFLRDGTVWLPEIGGNQVVKFDPATEKFSEYLVPSAKLGNVQAGRQAAQNGLTED